MAIKIYTPQINVSRKAAGSSSPNLNFGASDFYTTAAATADATGNALATYFINSLGESGVLLSISKVYYRLPIRK